MTRFRRIWIGSSLAAIPFHTSQHSGSAVVETIRRYRQMRDYYALRRFQENLVTENIPVIFLTGRQGSDLRHRLYGQGAVGYLTKPVELEALMTELERFLRTDKPQKEEAAACSRMAPGGQGPF